MSLSDGSRKPLLVLGHCHQMHMVWHQAIGPDLNPFLPAPHGHQSQVCLIVRRAEEDCLPSVATLHHMMRHSDRNDSGYPGHKSVYNKHNRCQ